METRTILIERTFNLPVKSVWKAWTEAECVMKWWGPEDFICPTCTIDFKVGGKYFCGMQDLKDGHMIWSTGVYEEIIQDKRIVMTDSFSDSNGKIISAAEVGMAGEWPEVLLISLEFQEHEGSTILLLKHEGMPEETTEDCIQGWQESFDKLERNIPYHEKIMCNQLPE
jgi:uncharacterized protein YndB with AHSA1/START domain